MEEIIFTTTNQDKLKRVRRLLKKENINIISLSDINNLIEEPAENFNNELEIACEKALYYISKLPNNTFLLTQDDVLKLENIEKEDDPKNHIKEPVIKKYGTFTPENAAEYYSKLATKYGGKIDISFHYGHAIAYKNNQGEIKVLSKKSHIKGILVSDINKLENNKDYFLSSLIKVNIGDKYIYYNELNDEGLEILEKELYSSLKYLISTI